MPAIPNQRPAAPWAQHGYWGQFDDVASLPNVAGADYQVALDLQAGDTAWSTVDGALYVCTDPTSGAAVWTALSGGGGGGGSLQDAYGVGNTVAATAGRPVALSNAVDTTDLLTLTRTFAGSGDGLEIDMGATTTGRGIRVVARGSGTGVLVTDGVADQTGISPGLIFQSSGNDLDIVVIGAGGGDINIAAGGSAGLGGNTNVDAGAGAPGGTVNLGTVNASGVIVGSAGGSIGFYGAGGAAKPTVVGSRGGNAALASLLTALALQGLITDGSTP